MDDASHTTFRAGKAFRSHVPVHPRGTDPSRNDRGFNQPEPLRRTMTGTWVVRSSGKSSYGRMAGATVSATATITVTAANIVSGRHRIEIGSFVFRPFLDFEVVTGGGGPTGNDNDDTAVLLAASIATLSGFGATARLGATGIVDVVRRTGVADLVELRVVQTSAASAFAVSGIEMTAGAPHPGAPLIAL